MHAWEENVLAFAAVIVCSSMLMGVQLPAHALRLQGRAHYLSSYKGH